MLLHDVVVPLKSFKSVANYLSYLILSLNSKSCLILYNAQKYATKFFILFSFCWNRQMLEVKRKSCICCTIIVNLNVIVCFKHSWQYKATISWKTGLFFKKVVSQWKVSAAVGRFFRLLTRCYNKFSMATESRVPDFGQIRWQDMWHGCALNTYSLAGSSCRCRKCVFG